MSEELCALSRRVDGPGLMAIQQRQRFPRDLGDGAGSGHATAIMMETFMPFEPGAVMGEPKREVQQLLETLPDDVTLEQIQYHIYVRQKIDRALEDVEAGRTVSQDEFEKRMARWLEP